MVKTHGGGCQNTYGKLIPGNNTLLCEMHAHVTQIILPSGTKYHVCICMKKRILFIEGNKKIKHIKYKNYAKNIILNTILG